MTTGTKPKQLAAQTALSGQARPGNQNAAKHDAYSKDRKVLQLRSRRVTYRVNLAQKTYWWLKDEKNLPTLRTWATLAVLCEDMGNVLVNLGSWSRVQGEDLIPRRLLTDFSRLVGQKTQLEDRLGITYSSRRAFALDGLDGYGDLAEQMQKARNGQ